MFLSSLQFNFFHNIIFVGIIIGFLLGLLLLSTPKFHKRENIFLSIFLLSFSFNNLYYFINDIQLDTLFPVLSFLPISLKTLIPVAAYLYILSIIYPTQKLSVKHWMLFLAPALQFAFYTFLMILYFFSSEMLVGHFDTVVSMYRLDELLSLVFAVFLTIAILKHIRRCRRNAQCSKEHMAWAIRFVLLGLTAVLLWGFPFVYLYLTKNYYEAAFYPMWSFSSVLVCWIGAQGFQRPKFFERKDPQPEPREKLSSSEVQHSQLRKVMTTNKPHKNPELSIKDLADLLGISVAKLRKVVKEEDGNYHKFVNRYRVEEAKELLTNPQNTCFTIEAVGEMAGFRSRATFFSSFKQYTGQTPQQYKNENFKIQDYKSK